MHSFTYGNGSVGSKRLHVALSQFLHQNFQPVTPIEAAHITITNGCGPAIEHCVWASTNLGDALLLRQPFYGSFSKDISTRPGTEVLMVAFSSIAPMSLDAATKYEKAILAAQKRDQKGRGLILCPT